MTVLCYQHPCGLGSLDGLDLRLFLFDFDFDKEEDLPLNNRGTEDGRLATDSKNKSTVIGWKVLRSRDRLVASKR